MKLKLILLLLTTISALHAGSLKLTDITTPTKKACADIACVLASHSGKLALATGVAGVLMYKHADLELKKLNGKMRELHRIKAEVLNHDQPSANDYSQYCPTELTNAINNYRGARDQLYAKEMRLGIGSARAKAEFKQNHNKTLPKNFSKAELQKAQEEMEQAEHELKEKEADLELQQMRQKLALLQQKLEGSFDQELRNRNPQELQAYYARLWYCGVCIFLASAISYSMYKAYPKLQKWYAAYSKPTIANAA